MYKVAVVGATGAVGLKMIEHLEKRQFPVKELLPLASKRSLGSEVEFKGQRVKIVELTEEVFKDIDIAFFSAGGSVSETYAQKAVMQGAVVIDNSNAFRMNDEVPLVVPEVNREDLSLHQGIIANPNCSTIQMVVALKPIYEHFGITKIVVSTYQAVSGSGLQAIAELHGQIKSHLEGEDPVCEILPVKSLDKHYPILFNALPQVDVGTDNGFTLEEMKMIRETKKILKDDSLAVNATCVRMPTIQCHAESIYVETETDFILDEVRNHLEVAPGVIVEDDLSNQVYPTPLRATNCSEVFVGRLRRDVTCARGLNLWVVSDSLLKGAAVNAIQIAECLVEEGLK